MSEFRYSTKCCGIYTIPMFDSKQAWRALEESGILQVSCRKKKTHTPAHSMKVIANPPMYEIKDKINHSLRQISVPLFDSQGFKEASMLFNQRMAKMMDKNTRVEQKSPISPIITPDRSPMCKQRNPSNLSIGQTSTTPTRRNQSGRGTPNVSITPLRSKRPSMCELPNNNESAVINALHTCNNFNDTMALTNTKAYNSEGGNKLDPEEEDSLEFGRLLDSLSNLITRRNGRSIYLKGNQRVTYDKVMDFMQYSIY